MKKFILILSAAVLAASALQSCEEMGGGKIEFLDEVKHGVALDAQGKASLRFKSSGPWTAKIEYDSKDEADWLSVSPESGEAGDTLVVNLAAKGQHPGGHTPGAKLRLSLTDGTDDTKAPVSWPEPPKVPVALRSFTLNPAGPLTLKVDQRQLVEIVLNPSNATEYSFRVDKPNGTAAFDIHYPYEESKVKFMIYPVQVGTGVVNVTEAGGTTGTLQITVTQ